jgi:glycosyltransferase involved in cell wall biosynthesis
VRAGLVIYGDLGTTSGGYLYDRHLVAALRGAGHTVDVISLPWRSYPRHLTDNLSPSLARRLANPAYDVLLQDELNHPSLALLNRRLRPRPAPIVSIVHHLRSDERWSPWQRVAYRAVERSFLATVDAFVVNSPATRRAVERLVGSGRPMCIAVPGRDLATAIITEAEVRARALAPGPLQILFVGNVIPRKGLHTLLQAVAQLPHGTWTLTVAGSLAVDRSYARAIGTTVADRELSPAAHLRGRLSDAELAAAYRAAHVLAVPSTHEGYGIVYLEGMGYGLPALATAAGGAADLVTHGETGYLAPPESPAVVAAALARLAADRPLLARMGVAALARAQDQPTWRATMGSVVTFLERLVSRAVEARTP